MKTTTTFFKTILFMGLWIPMFTFSQSYTVNGHATQDDCNCYTLTEALDNQHGSVWNNNKISLATSFDYNFTVFLGYNDSGADGIAFVLQPINTNVGSTGSGLGFEGIAPSIGVTIDTYQNSNDNDPYYDHIAIQLNGDLNHNSANNIAGPVQAIDGNDNIEDGVFHTFRVVWDADNTILEAYIDGVLRVSSSEDLVNTVLGGDPMVYWGFTGSTGGSVNLQRFCTQNIANFEIEQVSETACESLEVDFVDLSLSSSDVAEWNWDFGDGATSTDQYPSHGYDEPGTYNVTLEVVGYDGCSSEEYQVEIEVYENPEADFSSSFICSTEEAHFSDESTSQSGNITLWEWDFGDGNENNQDENPVHEYDEDGTYEVELYIETEHGCGAVVSHSIETFSPPTAEFSFEGFCANENIVFTDESISQSGNIIQWKWGFGDGNENSQDENPVHEYEEPGIYEVELYVETEDGCSDIATQTVEIFPSPTAEFSFEGFCANDIIEFTDESVSQSGNIVQWEWDFGDGNENNQDKNPVHEYEEAGSYEVELYVETEHGCRNVVSHTIEMFPSLTADFSFEESCANETVEFTDNSESEADIFSWEWSFENNGSSSEQNATVQYDNAGEYSVSLSIEDENGCMDSLEKIVQIHELPTALFSASETEGCPSFCVEFEDESTINNGEIVEWTWSFGNGSESENQHPEECYGAVENIENYDVSLIVVSDFGCSDTLKKDEYITVYPNPVADFTANPTLLDFDDGTVFFTNTSENAVEYDWDFGDNSPFSSQENPTHDYPNQSQDTFYVVLTVSNELGCEDTATEMIVVNAPDPEYEIPNVFTPNGDGENDIFKLIAPEYIAKTEIAILNRWGNEVFLSTDEKGEFEWNGNINNTGSACSDGVYFYKIIIHALNGKEIHENGFVHLIR